MKLMLFLSCAALGISLAQEAAPVDMAARRASVKTLEEHISQRQKRLDEVISEIRDSAKKTDTKIGELVKMLANVKDSQDSKRRVSEIKGEAVGGLKRMIDVYRTERTQILTRLREGDAASAEAMSKDMGVIDKLIEKRAADIVELVKSMPGGEDVAKYENDSDYSRNGVTYENSRISEAWRQNRRDKVQTEKMRRETQEALEKAIADLGSRQSALKTAVAAGGISDAEKEIQQQELDHVSSLIDQRKAQLTELSIPSAAPGDTASMNEATDMKRMFADAREDISGDFRKTLQLYHAAAAEREKIAELRENLAARIKWLAENDPAKKGK